MRSLSLGEILAIYRSVMAQSGGMAGIRDPAALESSLAQARMTFAGEELYPTVADKASALGYSLISNHPFVDGNKRAGHAAMETFLILNGFEIDAPVEEQERVIFQVASGTLTRHGFTEWLRDRLVVRKE